MDDCGDNSDEAECREYKFMSQILYLVFLLRKEV